MTDFVHLHTHSEYSLLDGLGSAEQLAQEAARLGQPALALTDHGVMHGAVEFFRSCKKHGLKPIIGVEAYMTPYDRSMQEKHKANHHLLLLAQNMTGYKNLLQICSTAQLEGYYYKPRIDAEFLAAHAEGLICTTGCLAAEVPTLLNEENGPPQPDLALERLRWYLEVFGRDRFYVELQEHHIPALTRINKTLFQWAKQHEIGLLVTNDVHYVTASDAGPHDTLLCVQTSSLKGQEKRMRFSDDSYYLKSEAEMRAIFRPLVDLPESAFTNSLKIAEMCQVDLEDDSFHLPDLPTNHLPDTVMPVRFKEERDYAGYLRYLTEAGLREKYGDQADSPEVQARKEHELEIIHRMGFDIYFLIVWDLCRYARERNIWWNVRGSGAGSIVAYAIGITLIDPLKHRLIFERFLNPGRISMPDFDLDYPDDQREEMIRYTIERYGQDRVAQIVSFGRMKARAAIRDVGRALDIPLAEVDRLAKQVSAIPGKPATIENTLDPEHEFYAPELKARYDNDEEQVRELLDTARRLEGVARHASVHAAAVIVTDRPLTDYVPVMRPQGSVITNAVTQFEFPICESIGLLKVDFLGLSTLTVMRKAAELIEARHGKKYTLHNIPVNDPAAFELMARGDVTGVFQLEGAGFRRVLTEMRPERFEHIVALLALYRPGPLQYIPDFIRRMHGDEEVTYRHPALEPILAETYGIIVYQEQIMQIATELAGYTASEADFMRKAVSKKKEKALRKHKSQMIEGGEQRGIPRETMEEIFADIEFFARYGFNKAHAADYAMVTCQTAYLKAHYPMEYMAALLTVERHNTDKAGMLVNECRAMEIEVLPPNINQSFIEFVIEERPEQPPAICFGLSAIKNVGEGPIQVILEARAEEGPFASLDDLCSRVDLRQVNRRALESLIKAGALDCFDQPRPLLLALIDRMMNLSSSTHKAASVGQISMFDLEGFEAPQTGSILYPPPDEVEEVSKKELIEWEKELVGTYLGEHPMQRHMAEVRAAHVTLLGELNEEMDGQSVKVAGLISSVRPYQTKKGHDMAFVELEDIQTSCEVVVFPRTYQNCKELLIEGDLIVVQGKVQAESGRSLSILADSITNELVIHRPAGEQPPAPMPPPPPPFLEEPPEQTNGRNGAVKESAPAYQASLEEPVTADPRLLHIELNRTGSLAQDKHRLKQMVDFITKEQGRDRFRLHIPSQKGAIEIDFPNHAIRCTDELIERIKEYFQAKAWVE